MMPRNERAKQFMPFDGVKGLREALAEVERRHDAQPKRELSEEAAQYLDRMLRSISPGQVVRITYYDGAQEAECIGRVVSVDPIMGYLKIGVRKYPFEDLYSIRPLTESEIPRSVMEQGNFYQKKPIY